MPHGDAEPADPNDARDDPVCDLAAVRVGGEFQAQAALDEGEGEEEAAPPDVQGGPDGSAVLFDVDGVVEGAEDGLEDEGDDDGDTDYGVVFVDLDVGLGSGDRWGKGKGRGGEYLVRSPHFGRRVRDIGA